MGIDGRVAVVTGAAAGIGQAIACRLAGHGARLVPADIPPCAHRCRPSSSPCPALSASGGVVVNIASTTRPDHAPYEWPEYAAAKAGLIRFTTAMAGLPRRADVRVTCVVPDRVRTPRADTELAVMEEGSATS